MAIDSATKIKVEAELRLGKSSKEMSDKYDIPYPTVNSWKKKILLAQEEEEIKEVLSYDAVTLHHVVDKLKDEMSLNEAKKAEKLIGNAIGLKRLEEKSRTLSYSILNHVEDYFKMRPDPKLKELKEAASIVSMLHSALFNKNTTQVNVMNNNNISTEKRDIFKSSLKA